LTVLYAYRLFAKNISKAIWGTLIFGSLTVLSHTESTVFAIAVPVYIWIAKSRALKTAGQGILIALGVFALAGPWYGLVIYRHGAEPLLSALATGGQTLWSVLRLINIDFITEEPYLDLIGVCGLLGMIFLIAKKECFIPGMLLVMYLAQPRSAHTVGNIPLAMAAGIFMVEILLPAFEKIDAASQPNRKRSLKILLAILTSYLLMNFIYQGFLLSQNHVSTGEQTAMSWVTQNTPPDSRFLVLTGEPESMCESTAEWFPALTGRQSLATLQGREWLLGAHFGEFSAQRIRLQNCIDEDLECLNREAKYFGENFDYIYLSIKTPTNNCKATDFSPRATRGLAIALENVRQYSQQFQI